jgi:membrane fusion protein, multidrug efflux system
MAHALSPSSSARFNYSRALLLGLSLAFAFSACKPKSDDNADDKKPEAKIPVEVALVERGAMLASFQGTAALEAEATAQVVSKSSGVILQILVEEGDRVNAGAVLARLENDRQRLSVTQAQANLRKVENDFKRQTELFNRKLIGSDIFERVKFELETQRASFDIAQLELSYTAIRAPIAGMVSQRLVKLGNQIQLGQALFRIDDFDPLEARVSVPEREMQAIKTGQDVQMLVDAISGQVFTGKVARVSPIVDPKTGTFDVIAQFQDNGAGLRSGMFGRVNIVTAIHPDALLIPRAALLGEGKDAAVFIIEGSKVKRVTLGTGLTADGKVEVLNGLKEGDSVVTLGQNSVREGSEIQVIAQKRPAATAPTSATVAPAIAAPSTDTATPVASPEAAPAVAPVVAPAAEPEQAQASNEDKQAG